MKNLLLAITLLFAGRIVSANDYVELIVNDRNIREYSVLPFQQYIEITQWKRIILNEHGKLVVPNSEQVTWTELLNIKPFTQGFTSQTRGSIFDTYDILAIKNVERLGVNQDAQTEIKQQRADAICYWTGYKRAEHFETTLANYCDRCIWNAFIEVRSDAQPFEFIFKAAKFYDAGESYNLFSLREEAYTSYDSSKKCRFFNKCNHQQKVRKVSDESTSSEVFKMIWCTNS